MDASFQSLDVSAQDISVHQEQEEERAPALDTVWHTTEAVKTSIGAIRTVYKTILTALVSSVAATDGSDPLYANIAHSLLRRVLRTIHGAERNLTHTYHKAVLLSDVPANIEAYLAESPEILEVWKQIA